MTREGNSVDSNIDVQRLLDRLCRIDADTVYFPVRHHSPTCAYLIGQWIDRFKPAAVLIEGPSDFNRYFGELLLDHELPITIYSYFRDENGHRGAYYPFCEYSPEWIALRHGRASGATVRFIDLPWSEVANEDDSTHRYADAEMRRGRYIKTLCERLRVEDFDDLWDKLIETHERIGMAEYFERVHALCFHSRLWEEDIGMADRRREFFMAEQIRQIRKETSGRVLVVTGGFHSSAIAALMEELICPGTAPPETFEKPRVEDSGIALTAYSYERLDSLTGYNAGMPNPGFYELAWRCRCTSKNFSHRPLLEDLVRELRVRKQTFSTADLIAVETSARALAALRGRTHVWRRDLVDAVTSTLIKDEMEYGCESPFLEVVHAVLRGRRRGRLASGTRVPPLVADIRRQLVAADLEPTRRPRNVELSLLEPKDLEKSRLLHRLLLLEIGGFKRTGGTDFLGRDDLSRLWEEWRIYWSPELESSCVEASRYGISLADAAGARLTEMTRTQDRSAAAAASLLVLAAQAGLDTLSDTLLEKVGQLIRNEAQFTLAATALGHLHFLYCLDEAFGTTRSPQIGAVFGEAFARSLWLLELTGATSDIDGRLIQGMRSLLDAFQRAAAFLELNADEFTEVLIRVEHDAHKAPQVRGAAAGILWTLGQADQQQILADLKRFADPQGLGDFLTGLFALAREVSQRNAELIGTVDRLLLDFNADDFQTALPSLRLAFTYFTPREKHYMLTTLFETLGLKTIRPPTALRVDESVAAEALAIEERLFETMAKYGLGLRS